MSPETQDFTFLMIIVRKKSTKKQKLKKNRISREDTYYFSPKVCPFEKDVWDVASMPDLYLLENKTIFPTVDQ